MAKTQSKVAEEDDPPLAHAMILAVDARTNRVGPDRGSPLAHFQKSKKETLALMFMSAELSARRCIGKTSKERSDPPERRHNPDD